MTKQGSLGHLRSLLTREAILSSYPQPKTNAGGSDLFKEMELNRVRTNTHINTHT